MGFLFIFSKPPNKTVPERHEGESNKHSQSPPELCYEGEAGIDPVLLLQPDLGGGVDEAHAVYLVESLDIVDETELTVAAGRETAGLLYHLSLLHLGQLQELSLVIPEDTNIRNSQVTYFATLEHSLS